MKEVITVDFQFDNKDTVPTGFAGANAERESPDQTLKNLMLSSAVVTVITHAHSFWSSGKGNLNSNLFNKKFKMIVK